MDTPHEVAVERLVTYRGFSEVDAWNRVTSQATREDRVAAADFVVDNGGSPEHLDEEVERCLGLDGDAGARRPADRPPAEDAQPDVGRLIGRLQCGSAAAGLPLDVTPPGYHRSTMPAFRVRSEFEPAGDQPKAIAALAEGVKRGDRFQTLLGITGSGKSATIAWTIEQVQKPTLVLAPNKSLAAQLANEFREFFPDNRVEYFVSYYDYYQPEAYLPSSDTYIEKDATINDEIDRLRHSATSALLTRPDTIVVASVSAIYGLGSPEEYQKNYLILQVGEERDQRAILAQLVDMRYERNDMNLVRGKFRVRGDTIEVHPAYDETIVRIEMFGDTIESITVVDPVTGERLQHAHRAGRLPGHPLRGRRGADGEGDRAHRGRAAGAAGLLRAGGQAARGAAAAHAHPVRPRDDAGGRLLLGHRELLGAHRRPRARARRPTRCIDFFPKDFLMVLDESHQTIPQIHGQYEGDRSRKEMLIEHGFRLPSAADNRPLRFEEWYERVNQCIFLSATPGPYELGISAQVVEQIVRPTGLVDPEVQVRPTKGQIDDLHRGDQRRGGAGAGGCWSPR